jgi:predicted  nucleic acid-binding Zn-ribbon protein
MVALCDEIERLRAEMDQRMAAYVEYQERDEAEIERLKVACRDQAGVELSEENDRLTANCKGWYDQNVNLIEQRDKVWEENKSLRSNNERLRAEMDQRMAAYVEYQERDEAEIERLRAENQEAWNKLELSEERERKLRAALEAIKANPKES